VRGRIVATLATVTTAIAATGCGGSTTSLRSPSWGPEHPDPPGVHFAAAQGLCTVSVRYPDEAPGEIDYAGARYIQHDRGGAPLSAGKEIGRSGDWTVHQLDAHTLVLLAPGVAYSYRDGANCGSNSAAPT
jgi:hypothetical protein